MAHQGDDSELIEVDVKIYYFGTVQLRWFALLLVFNAFLGLLLFEWAWYYSYIVRNHPKELNDIFPVYQRHDAKKWRKLQFYPGALTMMVPRFAVTIGLLCSLVLFINITMLG